MYRKLELSILIAFGIVRLVASKPVVTGGVEDKTKVAVSITQDVLDLTVKVNMYTASGLLLNRVERSEHWTIERLLHMNNRQREKRRREKRRREKRRREKRRRENRRRHHYRFSHCVTHTRTIQIVTEQIHGFEPQHSEHHRWNWTERRVSNDKSGVLSLTK